MTTTTPPDIDLRSLVDPARFAHGQPHDTWTALRRQAPVLWCEIDGYKPFWALTRHADIKYVSTHPDLFSSERRLMLGPDELERRTEKLAEGFGGGGVAGLRPKTLLNSDPPEHRDLRNLAGPFFRPSAQRKLEGHMRDITRALLDRLAARGPSAALDFTTDLAQWHPLKMIAEILGVAEEDEDTILRIANTTFGATDPEFAKDQATMMMEMFSFLNKLVSDKRTDPTEDLASIIANATLNGQPVHDVAVFGYLLILITAGHDTTKNAISGGMLALLENPDQLALLRANPELCASAADEIVRWTTPVMQFMRVATQDTEVGGQQIKAGEAVALFYPSANRDEEVFDEPFEFRVDRNPNLHLGWGIGEHYCIGASLAKMEIRVLLEELLPRLEHVELAGDPQWTEANFVCGVKHLPIRWTLRPAALQAFPSPSDELAPGLGS